MQRPWRHVMLWAFLACSASVLFPIADQAQRAGYVARVVVVVTSKLDDATFSALTPQQRAELLQKGILILDQQHALRSPETALSRQWLEFGKKRYMTDKDGYIHLPSVPASTKQIKVFRELYDKIPLGVLETISFVPEGHTPPASVLKLEYKLPASMDAEGPIGSTSAIRAGTVALLGTTVPSAARPVSHRTLGRAVARGQVGLPQSILCQKTREKCKTNPNAKGCCLDYNGPVGDGQPYDRGASPECAAAGSVNWIFSTCFDWSFLKASRACLNESAYPWNPKGLSCWKNHKYRICQTMDETDFHVNPNRAETRHEQDLNFQVHNNTPGNYTYLVFISNPRRAGKLSGDRLKFDKSRQLYVLAHFTDRPQAHYVNSDVNFKASKPPKKQGCAELYVIGAATLTAVDRIKICVRNPDCEIGPSKPVTCELGPSP